MLDLAVTCKVNIVWILLIFSVLFWFCFGRFLVILWSNVSFSASGDPLTYLLGERTFGTGKLRSPFAIYNVIGHACHALLLLGPTLFLPDLIPLLDECLDPLLAFPPLFSFDG